jgi:hypothetical protein
LILTERVEEVLAVDIPQLAEHLFKQAAAA